MTQWPDFGNIFYRSFVAKYSLHTALEMSLLLTSVLVQCRCHTTSTKPFSSLLMALVHCAEATQIQQFIMDKCKSHFCNTKIKSANISKYQTGILWSTA